MIARHLPLIILLFLLQTQIAGEDFIHPSDVVKEMKSRFKSMKSYEGSFRIQIKDGKETRNSSGKAYYRSGGRLNFTFSQPYGDLIISDGQKMWVYIARLNAVGVQDLDTTDKKGRNIYETNSYSGLVNLFRRYHYRFDSPEQPRKIKGDRYFVLDLKEKVSSGGYEKITLYVDPEKYLIRELDAESPSGRTVNMQFSSIELNKELPESLFEYKVKNNVRIVENPLTTEK